MSDRTLDVSALIDAYRNAFAPVLNAQQEGLKAFDRLAQFQYAVAGDYLELGLAQAKATLAATSAQELVAAQTEFGSRLGEQMRKRAAEFIGIATESQNTLSGIVAATAAKVVGSRKAA